MQYDEVKRHMGRIWCSSPDRIEHSCCSRRRIVNPPKSGDGLCVVVGNCVACCSLDFIPMNPPVHDEKGWTETVGKMVHVMSAPIT